MATGPISGFLATVENKGQTFNHQRCLVPETVGYPRSLWGGSMARAVRGIVDTDDAHQMPLDAAYRLAKGVYGFE